MTRHDSGEVGRGLGRKDLQCWEGGEWPSKDMEGEKISPGKWHVERERGSARR